MQYKSYSLQTVNPLFSAIWDEEIKFKILTNDKGYKVNDMLYLDEFDPSNKSFSGRSIVCRITDIFRASSVIAAETVFLRLEVIARLNSNSNNPI